MQTIHQSAPPKRVRVIRMTPELKALPVDLDNGVKLDFHTARCLRAYAEYHRWIITQKTEGEHVIVWRIG